MSEDPPCYHLRCPENSRWNLFPTRPSEGDTRETVSINVPGRVLVPLSLFASPLFKSRQKFDNVHNYQLWVALTEPSGTRISETLLRRIYSTKSY